MFSIHAQALLKEQSCQTSSSGNTDGSLFVTKHRVLFVCKLIVCFTLAINLIICLSLSFAVLCFARKTTPPPPPNYFFYTECAELGMIVSSMYFTFSKRLRSATCIPYHLFCTSHQKRKTCGVKPQGCVRAGMEEIRG